MKRDKFLWLGLISVSMSISLLAFLPPFQSSFAVSVFSPEIGDAVQGLVAITGNTAVDGFTSYELSFALENDTTQTWFLIEQSDEPVSDGLLGEWNTSGLTDDTYAIRLIVQLDEAESEIRFVTGIRLRNYTPIETSTPGPTTTLDPSVIIPTPTKTSTPIISPTPFSTNPMAVGESQIYRALGLGALFGLTSLVFLSIYVRAKR